MELASRQGVFIAGDDFKSGNISSIIITYFLKFIVICFIIRPNQDEICAG